MRSKTRSSSKSDKSWSPVAEAAPDGRDLRLTWVSTDTSSSAVCTSTFCEPPSPSWAYLATVTEPIMGCLITINNHVRQPISRTSH
jgi:hypothetical protein